MSRSYKHRKSSVIHFKEQNGKDEKREASAAVRRAADVPNGKQYRKFYESWTISDYAWTKKKYTSEEFRRKWFDADSKDTDKFGNNDFDYYRKNYRTWKEAYRSYIKYNKTK